VPARRLAAGAERPAAAPPPRSFWRPQQSVAAVFVFEPPGGSVSGKSGQQRTVRADAGRSAVFELISAGLANPAIAAALDIAISGARS